MGNCNKYTPLLFNKHIKFISWFGYGHFKLSIYGLNKSSEEQSSGYFFNHDPCAQKEQKRKKHNKVSSHLEVQEISVCAGQDMLIYAAATTPKIEMD